MIYRVLTSKLQQLATQFPVVAVLGPRQSGKTTLARQTFPEHVYVSLEDMDLRSMAKLDPRHFLSMHQNDAGVILDEIQHAPDLLSYIQTIVDNDQRTGRFIITGSQNFLVNQAVSQTLAGRVALLTLLPLSMQELEAAEHPNRPQSIEEAIFKGFYPRLYDRNISPLDWYSGYIRTYLERDVRDIKQVADLSLFQRFIKLCAGRVGQLVNLTSLSNDCGISVPTVNAWLSVLEASYIIFLLQPHHNNFNKRLVKTPKLYFYDTGLASFLLGIDDVQQINMHHQRGALFESLIISELFKNRYNAGRLPAAYFWRDKTGHEVDCLLEKGGKIIPVECKSSKTISSDYFKELEYWKTLAGDQAHPSFVVYAGDTDQVWKWGTVLSWKSIDKIFSEK